MVNTWPCQYPKSDLILIQIRFAVSITEPDRILDPDNLNPDPVEGLSIRIIFTPVLNSYFAKQ